ncbi:MAG: sigma-70 family RNA polymerase sigma factor [Planctomycetes bacterium]|nr:sigma-70 family RNA polymerase sigma factor [Planctomycetota bacterium]
MVDDSRERELVRRLQAGESRAFEELVRENSPRLLAVARRFFPSESDAMDALQDAYLSAFKAIGRFDGNSKLSTWLHRIVVNACLMKLRAKSRRPEAQIESMLPTFDSSGHRVSEGSQEGRLSETAEDALHRKESRELVRATIHELPEQYREVLLLRDIEELDTDQVAQMLDLTAGAVKTRLHRARLALKQLLEAKLDRLRGREVAPS